MVPAVAGWRDTLVFVLPISYRRCGPFALRRYKVRIITVLGRASSGARAAEGIPQPVCFVRTCHILVGRLAAVEFDSAGLPSPFLIMSAIAGQNRVFFFFFWPWL